jgi:hypothetical protein
MNPKKDATSILKNNNNNYKTNYRTFDASQRRLSNIPLSDGPVSDPTHGPSLGQNDSKRHAIQRDEKYNKKSVEEAIKIIIKDRRLWRRQFTENLAFKWTL